MYRTCLLQWEEKVVGYSWNSPTCAWPWIWPKWPKEGFCAPQWRKWNTWSSNLRRSSRRAEAGSYISRAQKGEGRDRMRPCYSSSQQPGRMPYIRQSHCLQSVASLEVQWNGWISTGPIQTADTRTDATSAWNATCTSRSHWGSSKFSNWQFATWISVFTCSSS